jgi:hypothetical protein
MPIDVRCFTTFLAPNNSSLWHTLACSIAAPVLGLAQSTNHVAGVGVGGSAGGGLVIGAFASLGLQVVADPQGNAGLALNFGASFFGIGLGAQGGAQFSASTAKNIKQLQGDAMDLSASAWIVGIDISHAPGGPTTGTLTVGPGVGVKASGAVGGSHTSLLTSTNCFD